MAELKAQPTRASVTQFIAGIDDAEGRADARRVTAMMHRAAGIRTRMRGPGIVGHGSYHYRYASGREGDQRIGQLHAQEIRDEVVKP